MENLVHRNPRPCVYATKHVLLQQNINVLLQQNINVLLLLLIDVDSALQWCFSSLQSASNYLKEKV